MAIGVIKKDPLRRFEGYVDKKETDKKIIRDVLKKGDSAFLTGENKTYEFDLSSRKLIIGILN